MVCGASNPVVKYAEPKPVVECAAPAPGAELVAPSLVAKYVAPAHAVGYVGLVPVTYGSPTMVFGSSMRKTLPAPPATTYLGVSTFTVPALPIVFTAPPLTTTVGMFQGAPHFVAPSPVRAPSRRFVFQCTHATRGAHASTKAVTGMHVPSTVYTARAPAGGVHSGGTSTRYNGLRRDAFTASHDVSFACEMQTRRRGTPLTFRTRLPRSKWS